MESIRRGLANEDALAKRDAEAYHQVLHGDRAGTPSGAEDDEMGHMVLGDMVEHHHHPAPQPDSKPSLVQRLAPLALTAGLGLAGGSILAPLALDQLRDDPLPVTVTTPAEPQPVSPPEDVDTNLGIELE